MSADSGSIWLARDVPYQVVRVEATATEPARIAQTISLPIGVRTAIALGAGSLWVADRIALEGSAVRRIDPETGEVVKTIRVDEGSEAMVFAYGSVWS